MAAAASTSTVAAARARKALSATLGSVVEAGARRYQHHEWTEDSSTGMAPNTSPASRVEMSQQFDHQYRRSYDDHECQQRAEQVRDAPSAT